MPIHIQELKLFTKLKANPDKKDQKAAASATKQLSKATDENVIRECVQRVLEILQYKLH